MNDTTHPQIAPAEGWWAVYNRHGSNSYYRVRVAAWITRLQSTEDEHYHYVEAMVPGDNGTLEPASSYGNLIYLWHDGENYCHCGADPHYPSVEDDIYWCERCAGEIAH